MYLFLTIRRAITALVLTLPVLVSSAATVSDVLNHADLAANNTTYQDFSGVKKTSAAIYAGNTSVQNSSIGMRSANSNSGIVTTASGGKVKSITVTWTSTASRTLQVYGKNTPYSSAAELYSADTRGDLLGTIVYNSSTSITISGDYEYIGLRSQSNMLSVKDLTIEWETGTDAEPQDPLLSFANATVQRDYNSLRFLQQATTIAGYDGTVSYSSTNTGYFAVNSSTGEVTWGEGAAGQSATITAHATATANYKSGTAQYILQLSENTGTTDVYSLVTDNSQIATTDAQYILVAAGNDEDDTYALGAQSGYFRTPVGLTVIDGQADIAGKNITTFTLEQTADGKYLLQTGGSYYLTQGSSNTYLTTTADPSQDKAQWTIEADGGKYRVMNASATTRAIAYSYNNGNQRFGCYVPSTTYKSAYLYVKGTPSLPEVTTIEQMQSLDDGTTVRLKLSEANCGQVQYVHNSTTTQAYMRDNTAAVCLDNFLPADPGWHTAKAMGVIGSIVGQYRRVNGLPTFISEGTPSDANNVLCIEGFCDPSPIKTTVATALEPTLRADYIRIDSLMLTISGSGQTKAYALSDGTGALQIDNGFHLSDIQLEGLEPSRTYSATGILVTDENSTSKLHLLTISEVTPVVELDESLDNTAPLTTYSGRIVDITVNRQLTPGMWNTLSLPFDVNALGDLFPSTQVAAFTGYNAQSSTLLFESTDHIAAGQPYLVYPADETEAQLIVNGVQLHSEAATVSHGDYSFIAIFNPTTLAAGDRNTLFLGQGNTLYYPSVSNTMKAFRAYFRKVEQAAVASVSIDGISTGIHTIATDPHTRGGAVYNLSGQRMANDTDRLPRGIYIQNGMKVIVR